MTNTHAFLIPGFMGFGRIGNLAYFSDDPNLGLDRIFSSRGIQIYRLGSTPTAAIGFRARAIGEEILSYKKVLEGSSRIHLIGHSTGGLDACELVSGMPEYCRPLQGKVVSITTIATPHYGTPLADFFDWIGAQRLIEFIGVAGSFVPWTAPGLLTDFPIIREVRDCIFSVVKGVSGLTNAILEAFVSLAAEVWLGRSNELCQYFQRMAANQGALNQLKQGRKPYRIPEGIRCFSHLAGATPADDQMPLARAIYKLLYQITGRVNGNCYPPVLQSAMVRGSECGLRPDIAQQLSLNDGVVPTRSMVWGQCLGCFPGDHMDIIGHPFLLETAKNPDYSRIRGAYESIAKVLVDVTERPDGNTRRGFFVSIFVPS